MLTQIAPYLKDYGLPAFITLLVVFGWLIPRWTHRQMMAQMREAWQMEIKRADLYATQLTFLVEAAKTMLAILESLPKTREPL